MRTENRSVVATRSNVNTRNSFNHRGIVGPRLEQFWVGLVHAYEALFGSQGSAAKPALVNPTPEPRYGRIDTLYLTDEVCRTVYGEYESHAGSARGKEEIGWVLLGYRTENSATVLATIPAGAQRDAGHAHIRFNSEAQALAARIVRQQDRKLSIVGVLHTHPGSMRHPSHGDYTGDSRWVQNLRGGIGVFGIGTVVKNGNESSDWVSEQPKKNAVTFRGFRVDWYTLGVGDGQYNQVAVELKLGPDLADNLRPVWELIENQAERLNRLARCMTGVRFEPSEFRGEPSLLITIKLGNPGESAVIILRGTDATLFHDTGDAMNQFELPNGTPADQAVYLLMSELAARS